MSEGFCVPTCECGHKIGEHKSSRSGGLHPSRYGICLVQGCSCREFVEQPVKDDAA